MCLTQVSYLSVNTLCFGSSIVVLSPTSGNSWGHYTIDVHDSVRDTGDDHECFNYFLMTKQSNTKEKTTTCVLNFIDKRNYAHLKNFTYRKKPITQHWDEAVALLVHHLQSTDFANAERARFNELKRRPNRKISKFILGLRTYIHKFSPA